MLHSPNVWRNTITWRYFSQSFSSTSRRTATLFVGAPSPRRGQFAWATSLASPWLVYSWSHAVAPSLPSLASSRPDDKPALTVPRKTSQGALTADCQFFCEMPPPPTKKATNLGILLLLPPSTSSSYFVHLAARDSIPLAWWWSSWLKYNSTQCAHARCIIQYQSLFSL